MNYNETIAHNESIKTLYIDRLVDNCDIRLFITITFNKKCYTSVIKNYDRASVREFQNRVFRSAAKATYRNTVHKPAHYPVVLSLLEDKDKHGNPCALHIHAHVSVRNEDLERYKSNLTFYAERNSQKLFSISPDVKFDDVYYARGSIGYSFKNVDQNYDLTNDILFEAPKRSTLGVADRPAA